MRDLEVVGSVIKDGGSVVGLHAEAAAAASLARGLIKGPLATEQQVGKHF